MDETFPFLSREVSNNSIMDWFFSTVCTAAVLLSLSKFVILKQTIPKLKGFLPKQFITHPVYLTPANWPWLLPYFCHFGIQTEGEALRHCVIFLVEGKELRWKVWLCVVHLTDAHIHWD